MRLLIRTVRLRLLLVMAAQLTVPFIPTAGLAAEPNSRLQLDAALDVPVDRLVQPIVDDQRAVGFAVGVIRDGKVVALRSYGLADREAKLPVDRQTRFRWASISKTLTAVAALQLAELGKLDLDADVRTYVPEFPDHGEKVTARQLLCHQGGIRHYGNGRTIPNERKYAEEHPFADVVLAIDEFKDSPLIARPGTRFSYSTHGYILLSAVVERAGQEPFRQQVATRICQPLGLATLQPDYQWIDIPHRAVGYEMRDGTIVPSGNTDVSWKLGGGGFLSTIDDLALWCAGIARGELLQPATWQQALTLPDNAPGRAGRYGLGFQVSGEGETLRAAHSGAQEKTRTFLVAWPRLGCGLVAMTNSEYGNPREVVDALRRGLFADIAIRDAAEK